MYLTTFDPFAVNFSRRLSGVGSVLPMDGVRTENGVLLRFDVPGIDPASIDITVDHGVLSVSAKRQEEYGETDRFLVRERPMGTVTRRVRLSDNLNPDGIEAAYTNGVLEVTIPAAERAKPRKVEIRATDGARELAN
jgi:HSP20 family protein